MNRWTYVRTALVGTLVLTAGCFGTETGNPPFAPDLTGDTGAPMGLAPSVSIRAAWIAVENVELVPECDAGASGTIVRHDPGVLALEGAQTLETEPVLQEGDYCALSLERTAWTGADPSALTSYTLAIDGTGPGGAEVRVRSGRTGTLRFVAESAFPMTPDSGGLLVWVDESLLFSAVPLTTAEREADGSIEISADKNSALLDQIESQLPGALMLYRDTDGDGQLSMDERAAGPLATIAP